MLDIRCQTLGSELFADLQNKYVIRKYVHRKVWTGSYNIFGSSPSYIVDMERRSISVSHMWKIKDQLCSYFRVSVRQLETWDHMTAATSEHNEYVIIFCMFPFKIIIN